MVGPRPRFFDLPLRPSADVALHVPLLQNDQPSTSARSPPILFVSPVGLPRDALIEWQVAFHTGQSSSSASAEQDAITSDEGEDGAHAVVEAKQERFAAGSASGEQLEWQTSVFQADGAQWGIAGVQDLGSCASSPPVASRSRS